MTSIASQKVENKSQTILASLFRKSEDSSANKNMVPSKLENTPAFNLGNINFHNSDDNSWVQPKLHINQPGDQYEQEADAMADKVMRMSDKDVAQNSHNTSGTNIQRKCAECEKEDEEKKVHRKEKSSSSQSFATSIVHDVLNSSSGKPMDNATRSFMESRFNYDFRDVRIHDNNLAAKSADSITALAYTSGENIVFNNGKYRPDSETGKRLLAHELTHIVQQASMPKTLVQRAPPGGQQGGQKFFDPSRGPLTDAEKAKLLAVRRKFNLPDMPTASDTSIVGVLITETGEELPFHSGERGGYYGGVSPADVKGGPGSGTNRINRTHVETWAANLMRQRGLKRAVLLIELEPCAVCGGYGKGNPTVDTKVPGVSAQLPDDAQLIVVDGQSANYFRQAPTSPQRPMGKVSPKPPGEPADDHQPGSMGTATTSPPVKGQGAKSPAGTDIEPGPGELTTSPPVKGQGGSAPPQKTTGTPPQAVRPSGLGIEIGVGVASVGIGLLASYLKARVDQKIAQRQIDAFLQIAKKKINANPDEAVKKMLMVPEAKVYAWVNLDSAVIATFGADSTSPEPAINESSPIFNLSRIDYAFVPVPPEFANSFPKIIDSGGRHFTTMRTIVIDIPLITPPLEDLISYAKARNIPLNDLYEYTLQRVIEAASSLASAHGNEVLLWQTYQTNDELCSKLLAEAKLAQKRKDLERQKLFSENAVRVCHSLVSLMDGLPSIRESITKAEQKKNYWDRIRDLIQAAQPSLRR